jgi:SAM-dependent methyltransferase
VYLRGGDFEDGDFGEVGRPLELAVAAFDGAFCFGNSFGYLPDVDNARFLHAVAVALEPGARFVIDYPAVAERKLFSLLVSEMPEDRSVFGKLASSMCDYYLRN